MKDHFIDDRALANKFDDKTFQFDDAKPSALLGREVACAPARLGGYERRRGR